MKVKVEKKPKSTLQINIVVPVKKVKESYAKVLDEEVAKAEIDGFRKGQAPKNIVEEKLKPSELYGEVVNRLLQTFYSQALKENKISPISNPKVEIKEFDLKKDFEFTATVATKPEIKIKDYSVDLKKLHKTIKENHKGHDHPVNVGPNDVLDLLISKTEIEVSDVLIDEEVERMLVRLIDQTQTLGMSLEDYLKAQNTTTEKLREDYKKHAENNIKAEFILSHLIEKEKIEVSEKEINDAIKAVGDEKVQEQMQSPMQKWYIRSVLAKNKLISDLISKVEIPKEKEKGKKKGKKDEK